MKIEYEMKKDMCLTMCENRKDGTMVNSSFCKRVCEHYQKDTIENEKLVLYCGFEEGR